MSHALGARYGVAHGSGNAILLPHVMCFNAGRPEGARRLKDVAAALGLAVSNDPVEAAAFYHRLGFDPSPLEPMTLMVTIADLRASVK